MRMLAQKLESSPYMAISESEIKYQYYFFTFASCNKYEIRKMITNCEPTMQVRLKKKIL